MNVLIRILGAAVLTGLLAGSALAQAQKGPAKYGDIEKPKTPSEIAAEKESTRWLGIMEGMSTIISSPGADSAVQIYCENPGSL